LKVSRKTATLLALTSLSKGANLVAIQLQTISFSDGGVKSTLNRLRKAQHSDPLHELLVDAWHQNPAICPMACMEQYIIQE
jgi:hypothetical protein